MLTPEQYRKILDRIDYWLEEDRKVSDRIASIMEVMAPSSYAPIIERTAVSGFIEGVESIEPGAGEGLAYYAYELQGMDTATGEINGKVYNLKDREQFIEFETTRT